MLKVLLVHMSFESAVSTYVIPDDSSDHCILMADFLRYFPHNELWGKKFVNIERSTR